MKKMVIDSTESTATSPATQPSARVGMHVLGTARTDPRVLRSAIALIEAGYAVTLIDIEGDATRPAREMLHGVLLQHIIMPGWFNYSKHFDPMFLVRAVLVLVQSFWLLLQSHADIYHAHDVMTLPAGFSASLLRRKPLIFDSHELPLYDLSARWIGLKTLFKHFLLYVIPRCSAVITVSQPIADEIRSRYGCRDVTLVRNIPEYQEVKKNDQLRQQLALGPQVRIALYQGALQPDRGLDAVVRAAKFLDPDIVVVLMGRAMRDSQQQLESLIEQEGVTQTVKILPAIPFSQLLQCTASADIGLVVLPPTYSFSIRMCLPNKLFEYMMAGLPILTSSLDAVVQIVEGYDVGRVVTDLTPQTIASAMNEMLADRNALARMSKNGLKATRTEFNWQIECEHLIKLYRAILSERKSVTHAG